MSATQRALVERVPLGGPQLGILDTNVLFNDLNYQLRKDREEGSLIQMAREGAVRLFAADHVFEEIQSRAITQERRGFSADELLALFERSYLPHIQWVDPGEAVLDPRVEAVTDPDDRPTAQVALLLAPCHVLTDDRHLTAAGFGRARSWPAVAKSVTRTQELDQLAAVLVELAKHAGRRLTPWLRKQVRDSSALDVATGVGFGLAVLAILPASGQVRLDRAIRGGGKLLTEAGVATVSVGREWAGERAWHTRHLEESAVRLNEPAGPEQRIARTLAIEGAMTAAEVGAKLAVEVSAVEATLRSRPAFVKGEQGWSLGRRRGSLDVEAR